MIRPNMLKMRRHTMPPRTDDDRAGARDVYANEAQRSAAGRLGLWLLFLVLAMLFGAVILLLLILRFDGKAWPEHLPPLPWQVWLSTGLLLFESFVLMAAVKAKSTGGVKTLLRWAMVIAVAFMASQAWAWVVWHDAVVGIEARRLALTSLYVVTGVHMAHVLGGLVPLGMLSRHAVGESWNKRRRAQLRLTATYWHFLDAVWVVLVVTLLVVL